MIGFKTKRFCFKICWQNKVVCVACNEWPSFGFLLLASGIGGEFRRGILVKWLKKNMFVVLELVWIFLPVYLFIAVHFWSLFHVCFHTNVSRVMKLLRWYINVPTSVIFFLVLSICIKIILGCVGSCVCSFFLFLDLHFNEQVLLAFPVLVRCLRLPTLPRSLLLMTLLLCLLNV